MILPVVGLLLLLGLFWYWASTLIGDDNNNPGNTPPTAAVVITTQTPSGQETTTAQETSTTAAENPQPTPPSNETETAGNNGATASETPTEEATQGSGEAVSTAFAVDDTVTTNDSVNMREAPDASGGADNVIVLLEANTELTIVGGPQEGPDQNGNTLVWWQVENTVTGDTGWVAEQYLEKS